MATLRDVARAANVSTMTVSNVLNNRHGKVSQTTAERVQAAIEELGYVPNATARSLSSKTSDLIAIVIQTRADDPPFQSSPYEAQFVGHLLQEVERCGRYVQLVQARDIESTAATMRSWKVDGAIFINTLGYEIERLQMATGIPMVFMDNYGTSSDLLTVRVPDANATQEITEYLISLGHRRLAFVGEIIPHVSVVAERLRGFKAALQNAGIESENAAIISTTTDVVGGVRAADQILALPATPTAVVTCADILAASVCTRLTEKQLRVPEDISVTGFDGLFLSTLNNPRLTVIEQDLHAKAKAAVELLFDAISGQARTGIHMCECLSLRVEASTAPPSGLN